jgi:hypothetical protein
MWSSDNWFIELKPDFKLLFIYLFSNERATMCGLYELPIRIMSFETGLDRETITQGLGVFNKADKVNYDFDAGVVWVKNAIKYQSQANPNEKVMTRIKADIKAVPDCALKRECMDTLSIPYEYDTDTTVSVSSKVSVSVSEERGGVGEKTKPALDLFEGYFGKFNSQSEKSRWLVIFEAAGKKQTDELAAWAFKKEIHLTNRGGLLDSLETAAKNWRDKEKGNGNHKTVADSWLEKKQRELSHGRS